MRLHAHHVLFGVSLLALFALSSWWFVFFRRAVEMERDVKLRDLGHATVVTALTLGHQTSLPRLGVMEGPLPLEIVSRKDRRPGGMFAPLIPNHPDLGVCPTGQVMANIEAKARMRRIMVLGEGSLLFVLLGICVFMLHRLVREERRHLDGMQEFVSAVTHEMKTPLTGIKSLLQTFVSGQIPDADRTRLLSLGLREAERLEHMVENVLLSGRLRTERYQICLEPIELRAWLDRLVEHRGRYLVGQPDAIRLVWELPSQEVRVLGDLNALNVIVENLTDNAFKYGGEPPRITLRVYPHPDGVVISVEDPGIGFVPELAEELFEPFRRALGHKDRVQHGTGLGLPIARTLASRMGAALTASSEGPGKGSRFSLVLKAVGS